MTDTKYIFVTGGVVSSLGKGIIAASLGKLLQARGYTVTIQKFDPYINVDPGTLNPYEHGECYVTVDGHEADLDLGHYERFLNIQTTKENNITTGRIYQSVISKERKGDYLGKTVQVVPHITDEIKRNIKQLGVKNKFDFVITEIGGTVGDIESLPFLESVRQLRWEMGNKSLVIHLTFVPYIAAAGELKTKPTQHSVKELQSQGIQPDMIVLRTEKELNEEILSKVALFCNVEQDAVLQSIDVPTIYEVPLVMQAQSMDEVVLRKMNMPIGNKPHLKPWIQFLEKRRNATKKVTIKLVGKYAELPDAYKSINESLSQAAIYHDRELEFEAIQSETITEENVAELLADADGIVVAPGFGQRGIEGKFITITYARTNDIPTFGICLGMQCMVVEYARNVLGLLDANSTEMNPKTPYKVIDIMDEQKHITNMGASMRLGAYDCLLKKDSIAYKAYGKELIQERHRHRYEFNNQYKDQLEAKGMICTGVNPDSDLVEIIEVPELKWFVGTQFHPEFNSTVISPNPLFMSFMSAIIKNNNKK
ncbi:MAG: CTP synthase [Dysgonamonadaceae bacterium]|nr:CTP synthase [Dysgonamonadaceae bacterium]MDD3356230.1 CTP synthase [Dysgonamonadaceae bacterium]MDD3727606.1 CTP synthase [Dysgonamonadaceae bacterium]MDD4604759.1 CTP synthase [Dysgonamonadaceae bacterium]HUI33265.1 CTP synthase [Dysgonamonadaceae bacterium]